MPKFFVDTILGDRYDITGEDALHIAKSLRMREGEPLSLGDAQGLDYTCRIMTVTPERVELEVLYKQPSESEPAVEVSLYQSLPKGDKFEWILQKAVELGVKSIHPVLTQRSIVRPDRAAGIKKQQRWQKLAGEAAKQSHRGIIPVVHPILPLPKALAAMEKDVFLLLFYEGGGAHLKALLPRAGNKIAIFIGPEGGFHPEEVTLLMERGAESATLGKRILRTETAPIAALSIIMHELDR